MEGKDGKRGRRTAGAQPPLPPQGSGAQRSMVRSEAIRGDHPCCSCHWGSSKDPSSTVILHACRVANELRWFKTDKRANTNLKTWISPREPKSTWGEAWWLVGDGADKGGLYSKWFILQMTGSLESLSSSTAAPAQKGQIKGKEEGQDTMMGHAGSEAAGWCDQISPRRFL